jgi:hypothetical protein
MSNEPSGNLNKGILAGNAPGNSLTTLYTAGKRGAENLELKVCNISGTDRTFRVQVINAAATVTRYVAFDVTVTANSLPIPIDFSCLRQGDLIKTYGSTTDVEFTLFGTGSE